MRAKLSETTVSSKASYFPIFRRHEHTLSMTDPKSLSSILSYIAIRQTCKTKDEGVFSVISTPDRGCQRNVNNRQFDDSAVYGIENNDWLYP